MWRQAAAEEALRLAKSGADVVGVVLNTVASARAVYEELKSKGEAILLTGRIRPFDRDVLLKKYLDRMKAERPRVSEGDCSWLQHRLWRWAPIWISMRW